jgi:hypothetical protein
LIAISLFLNIFMPFLNHAFIIFVTSDGFEIRWIILQPVLLLLLSFMKFDCCNSRLLNLPSTLTKRLQLVIKATVRAVTKTPKFLHISPILKSLHWLKIILRIQCKVLHSGHPSYLHSLLSLKRNCSTRSFSLFTLNLFLIILA